MSKKGKFKLFTTCVLCFLIEPSSPLWKITCACLCVCVCIDFFLAIYYLYPFDHKLIIPSPSCSSSNWIVNDNETCENSTESIELIKNDNVLSILLNLMKTFFKIYLLTLFNFVICFKDIFHKTIEHELYADLIHHTESNTHSLSFNKKKSLVL